MRGNRGLLLVALALGATVTLFASTGLDDFVQDALYDSAGAGWLVPAQARWPRLLFYRLPKVALAAWGAGLAGSALARLWHRAPARSLAVLEPLFLFSALALVPASVGLAKQHTRVHCPAEIERYGGRIAEHDLLALWRPASDLVTPGHCFPAAHASGGFALLALVFVGDRRPRRAAWGLAAGWVMGGYQMARGAHYLSHTLVSMLLAWGIVLLLARLYGLDPSRSERGPAPHQPLDPLRLGRAAERERDVQMEHAAPSGPRRGQP